MNNLKTAFALTVCGAFLGTAYAWACLREVTPRSPCDGQTYVECADSNCTKLLTGATGKCMFVTAGCCQYRVGTIECTGPNCSRPCKVSDQYISYGGFTYMGDCRLVGRHETCVPMLDPPGG